MSVLATAVSPAMVSGVSDTSVQYMCARAGLLTWREELSRVQSSGTEAGHAYRTSQLAWPVLTEPSCSSI